MEVNNKIIHYCWFGGNPLSDFAKKCIETWKKFLPDFEIKEWNEKNFDVKQCAFSKGAYEQKKWAFVADYTRIKVLEEFGGLYLDTDVEITKDISKFLSDDLVLGQEDSKMANAAVVWVKEKHNQHIKNLLEFYESQEKFNASGDMYDISIPRVTTKYLETIGFNRDLEQIQKIDHDTVVVYPMEYFYPLSYDNQHNKFTENSVMIHHFDGTWTSKMEQFKTKMKRNNMKWVVHIIDFFINIKNNINYFLNFKDISIFVTLMVGLLLATFTFLPVNSLGGTLPMFTEISNKLGMVVLQITLFSALFTFICSKIRLISVNKIFDKITGTNQDLDGPMDVNRKDLLIINDEQKKLMKKSETIMYLVEYVIVLIILVFTPIITYIVAPQREILFVFAIALLIYYIYLGANKNYKYRIMELVPIGILLTFLTFYFPFTGIIIAAITAIVLLLLLFKNKVSKKRKIAFVGTIVLFSIIFLATNMLFNNLKLENNLETNIQFSTNAINLNSMNDMVEYESYQNVVTEFNAGKNIWGNILIGMNHITVLLTPTYFLYFSIVLIAVIAIVNKNKTFLALELLPILMMFSMKVVAINSIQYALSSYLMSAILLMMLGISMIKQISIKKVI